MRNFFGLKLKTFRARALRGVVFVLFLVTILALGYYFTNFSLQAASHSITWTTKEDFETNAATTGTPTTRLNVDTASSPGDVKIASVLFDTGTGAEGDLVVNGTTVTLDGRHYFNNVTIINGGVLTHSTAAGAGTGPPPYGAGSGVEGLELYVTGTLYIDATSRIDVTGKGYDPQMGIVSYESQGKPADKGGPGAGWNDWGGGAGGGAYGGAGGYGYYVQALGGLPYGTPTGVEYMGSGGGNSVPAGGTKNYGGAGGGRLKIVASFINIEGAIQANGNGGEKKQYSFGSGGGSGGGIYLASPTVNISGYVSAAAGGGGGDGNGTAGFNGTGGNGAGGGLGGPPGLGGNGGNYGQNGGFSAGGGGFLQDPIYGNSGAGGGGAGRVAIYSGTFNGGLVAPSWDVNQNPIFGLPGEEGFADAPSASNQVGPYAYFSPLTALTSGVIGGTPYGNRGLRVDVGAKANWKSLDWKAEPLTGSQNIEFQIRVADSLEELASAVYVGWDGTSRTWFDESNKNIPASVPETRYAEIQVRLTASSSSPILHNVTLTYDVVKLPVPSNLSQYKSDGITPIFVGDGTNESSVVLKAKNIQGMESSTGLFAEFEVKPVNQAFDGQNIVVGNPTSSGGESLANVPLPPDYLGNVASGKPYTYYPYLPRPEYPDTNQIEFTDGDPSTTFAYTGWSNVDIVWDITVDLGQVYNIYQTTLHSGGGLKTRTADSVEILTSVDNINFTSQGVNSSGSFQMTLNFPLTQARYVKFRTVKKLPPQGDFFNLFLGEGEVYAYAPTLPPEQGYHWRVRIKDGQERASTWSYFGGNSDGNPLAGINAQADFWLDTNPPSVPGTPATISSTIDTTPTWNWNSSTDNGSGIKGYYIYVGTSPGTTDIINGDFTPTNSYTHFNPLSLGTYYAYVKAVDKADNLSGPSSNGTVEITSAIDPAFLAPTSLNVTLGSNDVNLTWAPPAVGDVDHYNIYRAYQRITNANKSQAKLLATTSTLTYIDLTGLAGKTYYYQVTAVNNLGEESGVSTAVINDNVTIPRVPNVLPGVELAQYKADGLTPIAVGGATNESSLVLEAQGVTGLPDSTDLQAQFEVKSVTQAFDETGLINGNIANVGESSRVTLNGLAEGAYHWRARIIDGQGRVSSWTSFGGNSESSPPTIPADPDFYIDTTPPSKPGTPTTPTPTDDTTPTWSWTTSTDSLSGLKGYHIFVGTTAGGADIVGDAFVAENSFTHPTQLEGGKTYYATIRAEDNTGNLSETSDSGTVVIAYTVPANLNVEAEPAPSKKINLTWTGPGVSLIDHYNVYRSTVGSITNANLSQAERIADNVTNTSYTDGSGYPGETYYYQVTAIDNSNVESEVSIFVINDQATVAGENPHGDYSNITGKCRNCHKVHLAKGTKKIFRKSPNIEVCYTCHDGSGSTFNIRVTFENLAAHEKHLAAPPDTEIVCTNCHHPHAATNFLGVGGGERMTKKVEENLCLECHDEPISVNQWNIKEQFEKASRHAITGITADGLQGAKVECSSCHGPHTVQRGQGLSDPNKRLADPFNTYNLWSGTFTDFCLNCHRSGDLPQKTATTEVFVPYTIQFPEVKQFLFFQGWDKTPFKTSEHNKKGITCQRCHHSHGSDNPRLNAFFDETLGYDTGEGSNEEKLCFKCHNPDKVGGAPDIKTPFEKASAHPVIRRAKHKDTEGPMDLGELNRHVECVDCHDPHRAKAGLHKRGTNFAGNILTGMKGVGVINGIPGISPTLYYPADPIIYEYQLCFKCHSSYTYLPTNVPERTEVNNELPIPPKDKAKELNPNNLSYHPVEGIGKNLGLKDEAFTLGTPWNPTPLDEPDYGLTGNVGDPNSKIDPNYPGKITCTDCHGNDDPSGAQGPHGSANLRILKKPFTYKEELCGQFCHPGRKQLIGEKELCFQCHNPAIYRDGGFGSRFWVDMSTKTNYPQPFPREVYGPLDSGHYLHVSGKVMNGMSLSCYQCHEVHGSQQRPHLIRFSASYENNKVIGFSHSSSTQSYCDATHHQGGLAGFTHGGNALFPQDTYIHAYPHISGEAPLPNRFEEVADEFSFTGIWWLGSNTNASGGRYLLAPNAPWNDGATTTLTFEGTKVSWISKKGPDGGYARVYVDGILEKEIDLCSSTEQWQKVVYTKEGLASGIHTITIELKYRAQNNCASTLPQNQEVIFDAFDIE